MSEVINLVTGEFVGLAVFLKSTSCSEVGRRMGVSYEYSYFSGCMINVNDHWIPLDSYYVKEDLK